MKVYFDLFYTIASGVKKYQDRRKIFKRKFHYGAFINIFIHTDVSLFDTILAPDSIKRCVENIHKNTQMARRSSPLSWDAGSWKKRGDLKAIWRVNEKSCKILRGMSWSLEFYKLISFQQAHLYSFFYKKEERRGI